MWKLILLALALVPAWGSGHVVGVLYDAQGKRASGSLVIEWPSFTTAGSVNVAAGRRIYWVVSGIVDLSLEETVGASPAGTAYRVSYRVAGYAGAKAENWEVPAGTSTLSSVRRPSSALPGSGVTANFADAEVPGGLVDGGNVTFILAAEPSPIGSLILARNGVIQKRGADYNLSGATVTFLSGAIPQAGDLLQAWYRY